MIVVIVNEAKVHTKSGHLSENKNTTQVSKLIEANNLDIYTTSISIKAPTVTGLLNGLELYSPNVQSCKYMFADIMMGGFLGSSFARKC